MFHLFPCSHNTEMSQICILHADIQKDLYILSIQMLSCHKPELTCVFTSINWHTVSVIRPPLNHSVFYIFIISEQINIEWLEDVISEYWLCLLFPSNYFIFCVILGKIWILWRRQFYNVLLFSWVHFSPYWSSLFVEVLWLLTVNLRLRAVASLMWWAK